MIVTIYWVLAIAVMSVCAGLLLTVGATIVQDWHLARVRRRRTPAPRGWTTITGSTPTINGRKLPTVEEWDSATTAEWARPIPEEMVDLGGES